ncbi:MAG TPA: PASTA domain-containing protein [Sedimentisphaerales bacterium]|nr:PASTA domain-containing protein [Sedimentisphaerales bacterium]
MSKGWVFCILLAALLLPAGGACAATWTNSYLWTSLWHSEENWDPPVLPGPLDDAYINCPPEQGPAIDMDAVVGAILGPRYDSNSSQAMYVFAGNLTVNGDWRFGIGGSGTSIIHVENDAGVTVNGLMLHRTGGAAIYISDNAHFAVNEQMLLADFGWAILDISGEPYVTIGGDLRAADSNTGWFEAHISGGSVSVGGVITVGDDGGGLIEVTGGTAHCRGLQLHAGSETSTATLDVNGGAVYVEETMQINDGNGTAVLKVSSGTVDVGELHLAGGAGSAAFEMTGGSVVVRGAFVTPEDPNGTAMVSLHAGTLECGSFLTPALYAMDINDGVLIIDGDDKAAIVADINAGYITPSCVPGDVLVDFNNVNPGRTTVWVVPYFNFEVVPKVAGMYEADAETALKAVGLYASPENYVYHNTVPGGIVISQYPIAGTGVPAGSPIGLSISLGRPVVPDVVGMSEANAVTAITGPGILEMGTVSEQYSNTMAAGFVVSQQPVGGTMVLIGSAVNIVISLGRPVVPDVRGMSQAEAAAAIEAIDNLTVGVVTEQFSNTVPIGCVVSQYPDANTAVLIGSAVDLVLSLGPSVIVPGVVGTSEPNAITTIGSVNDLTVGAVTQQYSNTVAAGVVISQYPAAGAEVPVGSSVDLVVSLGRPVVLNVVGMTETDAKTAIEGVDNLAATSVYEYHNTMPAGSVIRHEPPGGTAVLIGSTVTLTVSLGRPVVPDVVGQSESTAVTTIRAADNLTEAVSDEYDNTIPAGQVIRQIPAGGTEVDVASVVSIVVSLGRPVVPDVVGWAEGAARAAIEAVDNLSTTTIYEYHNTVPADNVINQNPAGQTPANIGETVTLTVSTGRPIVPSVVGQTEAAAISAIESLDGFMVSVAYEYHSTAPADEVIRQDPPGETAVEIGTTVSIVVSLGPPVLMVSGGHRLVELQNNDGGWDLPLDDGDPNGGTDANIFGLVATGLAQAYRHNRQTTDANMLAALEKTKTFLLSKMDNFAATDGALAVELDDILGGTTCVEHVNSYFYEKLGSGTYYDAASGLIHDTASYIQAVRDRRFDEGAANLAAWDLGLAVYSAHVIGADTAEWVEGLKAEIDELDGSTGYDVLGLAGAVLGLAAVGEDFDPWFGQHAAASSLSDLAAILASYQLATGGFTWHWMYMEEGMDEEVQETVYGLMALNEFDRAEYLSNINGARLYLQGCQLATGGWENYAGYGEDNQITGETLRAIGIVFSLGDFDQDGDVDLKDYALFTSGWATEAADSGWNRDFDISIPADNRVDGRDLSALVDNWLSGRQ